MPTRTAQETPKKAKTAARSGKPNALQRPLQPSEALAAVVGPEPLPRGEVVSKVWEYIKSHNLQNPENRREILADDKLKSVFGKDKGTMFEMNKHLSRHLTSQRARSVWRPSAPRLARTPPHPAVSRGASGSEKAAHFTR